MHHAIYSHLAAFAEMSAMKNRRAGRHKHFILDCAADDMCIRANEAVITDLEMMFGVTPQHCILENDTVGSNRDRSSFRYNLGAKENPASAANRYITANNGVRRYIRFRRYTGRFPKMIDRHEETVKL
jgi:hypothetical protein